MTYFVYIDLQMTSVPHMEPLEAVCPRAATIEALERLRTHTHGTAAHVYDGDTCVASMSRDDLSIRGLSRPSSPAHAK